MPIYKHEGKYQYTRILSTQSHCFLQSTGEESMSVYMPVSRNNATPDITGSVLLCADASRVASAIYTLLLRGLKKQNKNEMQNK